MPTARAQKCRSRRGPTPHIPEFATDMWLLADTHKKALVRYCILISASNFTGLRIAQNRPHAPDNIDALSATPSSHKNTVTTGLRVVNPLPQFRDVGFQCPHKQNSRNTIERTRAAQDDNLWPSKFVTVRTRTRLCSHSSSQRAPLLQPTVEQSNSEHREHGSCFS